MSCNKHLMLGFVAATAFVLLAGVNLSSQGLYYDELHQATAAFDYLGSHPAMFNHEFHGIPILNMSYSGAIKSNIYGLYLKFFNPHFSVYSWRILGIVLGAAGVIVFYSTCGLLLSAQARIIFGLLILTDGSLLLMCRHDWGPAALAFSLRLAFIGVWLSIALSERRVARQFFIAGTLAGIAMFEKLSAVGLIMPLGLLLAVYARRNPRIWIASSLGVIAGSLPLLAVNAASWMHRHGLVSLSEANQGRAPVHAADVLEFAIRYAALGNGGIARFRILGDSSPPLGPRAEAVLMTAALILVLVMSRQVRAEKPHVLVAGLLSICYGMVAISLLLLPRDTDVHHWLIGTPFQYAAIAIAVPSFRDRRKWSMALLITVTALLALRVPNLMALERSLARGKSSVDYDPSFTHLAEMAAGMADRAVFLSADWGTATQIYCVGNGRDDLVYEPFWGADPGGTALDIVRRSRKDIFYVLVTGMKIRMAPAAMSVVSALSTSPVLDKAPVEESFQRLRLFRIWKFVRRSQPGRMPK